MAKQKLSGGILHFNAVQLRVTGNGNLQLSLQSRDGVKSTSLANTTLSPATDREPLTLSNFTIQAAQLKITTTNIYETFLISKIVIFAKPVATGYPQ